MDGIATGAEKGPTLDEVLQRRRSVRTFKEQTPPPHLVEEVLQAGMLAPYAALAGGTPADCRRFFVFTRGTVSHRKAEELMRRQVAKNAFKLAIAVRIVPAMRRKARPFAERVRGFAQNGIPAFKTAPYLVVVAERRGFPPAQKQSIAHAMENMWLKATALGLGFHLFSAVGMMADNRAFAELLGLPPGEFEIDGCAMGYPGGQPVPREPVFATQVTRWME
ncbi:MAG TPA: nitroreductase family protein [Myxococcales bacterium]|jgi:nitroreductase